MSDLFTATELKERIQNNDNRCTASPYLLLLRERRKVSCDPDYNYDGCIYIENVTGDYHEFESKEKAENWIRDFNSEDENYIFKKSHITKFPYQTTDETVNVFLTDKGYQEHLSINAHNLRDHNSFGIHAFRNKEMKSLLSLIDKCIELEKENTNLRDQNKALKKEIKILWGDCP